MASDKARFRLEATVPELQSYQRKGIFTPAEIRAITAKRSTFEHTLHARGSKASDYARYAHYEMNLASLRKKRCARLGVKDTGTFSITGQRTIFQILDRGTKKFPGDVALWTQYIAFCRTEGANKKIDKVLARALRLLPRRSELWVLAAAYYAEVPGDVGAARGYLQRGLRFCADNAALWREYLRLEMGFLARVEGRKRRLGSEGEKTLEFEQQEGGREEDDNMIALPDLTAIHVGEDTSPSPLQGAEELDPSTLTRLSSTPALQGAIPIAIFDAAMKQFNNSPAVAADLFTLVATFDTVPSTPQILQHVLSHLNSTAPESAEAVLCEARLALFGIEVCGVQFPTALGQALTVLKKGTKLAQRESERFARLVVEMLQPYLKLREELDEDVVEVLEASLRRYERLGGEAGLER